MGPQHTLNSKSYLQKSIVLNVNDHVVQNGFLWVAQMQLLKDALPQESALLKQLTVRDEGRARYV